MTKGHDFPQFPLEVISKLYARNFSASKSSMYQANSAICDRCADGYLTKRVSIFIIATSFIDYDKQIFAAFLQDCVPGAFGDVYHLSID